MSTSETISTELLHAQAQIWNYIFNFISSSAVTCAFQLGIPDVLYKHEKPMCLSDLSAELSVVNSSKISFLPILMRFLVQSGFLNQHEDHYFLTPASRLLVKNEPFNVRSFLLFTNIQACSKAWHELSDWFQNDSPTPFQTAHGKSLWDYMGEEKPRVLECKHVFEGLTSLVDVGGATGTVALAIAKAIPNINCVVLDLPQCVLHDWNDEDCVKILKKCKQSIPSKEEGGKLIIINTVLEENLFEHNIIWIC
ncbi:hypothetical protein KY285_001711 [Solanum tuberosum]|nr:hypothetical protein KY289_001989 [Solanum tuberosum]KAH0765840.1 hypothetical protein KY285_001711 [Solanum tuberosum]